jgi:hypothetical protein
MSPSIEKTPSTTIITPPPSPAALSSVRSSLSIRLWRKARSFAFERIAPSSREAWSPESTTTVSQGAERAEVGLLAGREDDRVVGAHPVGELLLELEVQAGRAVEQARPGQAGPVAGQGVARALHDPLVGGQAEVVVGAEHDPRAALHLHDRQRRGGDLAEVREQAGLAGRAHQGDAVVVAGLGKDVGDGVPHIGSSR